MVRARNVAQDLYLSALERHELVFAEGPAGTGKTWLAVGHAVSLLEQGVVERLILTRPAVEAGERLGFLPGDMRDKVDPYLRPIYDALHEFMEGRMVERGIQTGMIEIAPLAFMRGRTLAKSVVLLDEAQNATSMQMKMFLTRLGEGSRMIVNGDPTQTDLPPGQKSGLSEAVALLGGLEGVGHVRLPSWRRRAARSRAPHRRDLRKRQPPEPQRAGAMTPKVELIESSRRWRASPGIGKVIRRAIKAALQASGAQILDGAEVSVLLADDARTVGVERAMARAPQADQRSLLSRRRARPDRRRALAWRYRDGVRHGGEGGRRRGQDFRRPCRPSGRSRLPPPAGFRPSKRRRGGSHGGA